MINRKVKNKVFAGLKVKNYKELSSVLGREISSKDFNHSSLQELVTVFIKSDIEKETRLEIIDFISVEITKDKEKGNPNWNSCINGEAYRGGFNMDFVIAYLIKQIDKNDCFKIEVEFTNGSKYFRYVSSKGVQEWESLISNKSNWA